MKLEEVSIRYRKHMESDGPDFEGESLAAAYERHCISHFDEVVAALEESFRLLSIAYRSDGEGDPFGIEHNNVVDSLSVSETVLAKAKEVETK